MAQQPSPATPQTKAAQTFDKNRDLNLGERTYVFLAGYPIAYVKSDDLKFTPSQQDVSSKLSGKYDDKIGGKVDWSLTVEAILSQTKGHMSFDALMNLSAGGQSVDMEIKRVVVKDTNGVRTVSDPVAYLKGKVTVSDLSRKSSRGEHETFSVTLSGSGPLLDATGKEVGSDEALAATGITLS
ncbi:hypothetical protein [Porphyromonas sp. oral taxon 275]|uniref:hypothetical protein n=1 Tax=Porphyromonas sp. oral taxon 275 TaxID=712435 RepID=UPI001BA84852|nr:hypothetical protein [Porphyromonas sp. oral taxon 275]QUB43852.1 hypothetical protein J4862_04345 [Porphyromonas sp. oral taxon 275]